MSEAEKDAVIGKMIREYQDAKLRCQSLQGKAAQLTHPLGKVVLEFAQDGGLWRSEPLSVDPQRIPTREQILDLAGEIVQAVAEREAAKNRLLNHGISLKD